MELIELTKKLISIPSFVGQDKNEMAVADFIFKYLQRFSFLQVEKQIVEGVRFNIIAKTKGKPKLFFAGHMDTVCPKKGWTKDQFKGETENDKLFGIGAIDTKSGVAALLYALNDFDDISGLTMLFYCDEEYDFKGMKKFIKDYDKTVGDFSVFIEPTSLKICNAHRGLVEIKFIVRGETGHAKTAREGKSAILATAKAIKSFEEHLVTLKDKRFGESTMNVAYIKGGLDMGKDKKGEVALGREGNNIADYTEFIIDVRPAVKELTALKIVEYFKKEIKKNKCLVEFFTIRHDYSCLSTNKEEVSDVEDVIKKAIGKTEYLDSEEMGYGEAPLIQEKYQIPVIYFGPKGGNAHGVNEWVDISSIYKTKEVYRAIIDSFSGN